MTHYILLSILALSSVGSAYGSLVLLGPAPEGGTGLGAVNTVLTLQSPGNSLVESGCTALSGGSAVAGTNCGFNDSNVKEGNGQIGAPSLATIGTTSASDLRIVFNAAQPGNTTAITINELALYFFGTGDTTSTSFTLAAPVTLSSMFLGVGQSGYLFGLDAQQSLVAQSFIDANGGGAVRIGLGSSIGCPNNDCTGGQFPATGGLDTFSAGAAVPTAVPEPASLLLMAAALPAFAILRKRLS